MRFKELNPFMPAVTPRGLGIVSKGGGGGDTIESIPSWYKPYIQKAAGQAGAAFDSGALGTVAGLNEQQQQGIDALSGAANEAINQYTTANEATSILKQAAAGEGIYGEGATQGLKDAAIRDSQAAFAPMGASLATSGQIGGARAGLLAGERDANLASALAGIDYQDLSDRRGLTTGAAQQMIGNTGAMQQAAGAGAGYQGQAGQMLQEQSQRELDATYQGLSRLGSLLSGSPVPSQTQSTGGK
jgi:hypothetical protein